jgi:hypothetical protein
MDRKEHPRIFLTLSVFAALREKYFPYTNRATPGTATATSATSPNSYVAGRKSNFEAPIAQSQEI